MISRCFELLSSLINAGVPDDASKVMLARRGLRAFVVEVVSGAHHAGVRLVAFSLSGPVREAAS